MMFTFEKLNKNRILLHILFWIGYVALFTFQYGYSTKDYLVTLYGYCIYLPVLILAVYSNLYFIIPKYLLEKRYLLFYIFLFISAAIFTLLQRAAAYFIIAPLLYPPQVMASYIKFGFFYPYYLTTQLIAIYSVVIVAAFIKLFKNWLDKERTAQQLSKEKVETELMFLKSQIHPHFLFNVLNAIYALTLKKSDLAPEMVLKLSSLLDYMIYECNTECVPLCKEIKIINDYIELEKIRYGYKVKVQFKITGTTNGIYIAPLILFPLIENCFKHGINNEINNSWIDINMNASEDKLIFMVENSSSCTLKNETGDGETGIGLNNVKRRLDLLYYNKHQFRIEKKENSFAINLEIIFNRK
ncbi:MAG: histidine kinase [Ignavibacteriales bacterium]|nr:histidine kinase [Ignavibacteriales bacterium]